MCDYTQNVLYMSKEENIMKKKLVACLMTATMALGLLTGCGTGADTTTGTSTDVVEGEEDTLKVWAWDQSFNIAAMKEAEKIYQKENPNFKLEIVETPWDDMQTQLGTIVASGDYSKLPDILLMQDYAFQKYAITYSDLFTDLTNCGINFSEFAAGKLAASTVDGKKYGVPFDNGAEIAAYRTDILEQAGYTLEDLTDIDWERYIEIGTDVYEKTGYSLLSVQAGSSDLIYQMLQSAGFGTWNEDGTPNIEGNENIKQCMEIYKQMVETNVLSVVNSWDEYIATFTSGKTAGVINGCWIMASIQTAEEQSGKWGITNIPSIPGVTSATNYSSQGGSTWTVTSNCVNKDLAFDFLSKTFAGSVELYDTILPASGALATWIPASESAAYTQPQEFYGGQQVFSLISDYATKVPTVDLGVYYVEANTALATAIANVLAGSDIEGELATAQKTVEFNMGQ